MTDRESKIIAQRIGLLLSDVTFNSRNVCKYLQKEHKTLQQSFTRLCIEWLNTCASDDYVFDGRNEASHTVSKSIMECIKEQHIDTGLPFI